MAKSIKPLLLHTMDKSWRPNPLKVAILLEALQIPYSAKQWISGVTENAVEGSEFKRLNPHGRTPVLEDPNTGVLVWESGAVLEYVLRTYGQGSMLGPESAPQSQADFDQWNHHVLTTLAPAIGEMAFFKQENNSQAVEHFQAVVHASLDNFNTRLRQKGQFLMGNHFTALDMNAFPWLNILPLLDVSFALHPDVERWLKTCQNETVISEAIKTIEAGQKA
jgi:glutathione S-transferase